MAQKRDSAPLSFSNFEGDVRRFTFNKLGRQEGQGGVNSPSQHKRGMIKEIISEAEFETDMTEMT